jgi:dihydrofolate reductase
MISLIAAIGKNNEIGKGADLIFKMPADMKHFRDITSGHTVLMGRKTFESIGRALPNRRNIIVTRDQNLKIEGAEVVHSLGEALRQVEGDNEHEIFIIGGGEIYKETINKADKLYITKVDAEAKDADVFFPKIDKDIWRETKREEYNKDEKNIYDYAFVEYEKI